MHGAAHLKPLGHEAQGSYYVGGKRKKLSNPDEVGAVKDHFSEDAQQEKQRPQKQQKASPYNETESLELDSFDLNTSSTLNGAGSSDAQPALPYSSSAEDDDQYLYGFQNNRSVREASAAHLTTQAINSLFAEVAIPTAVPEKVAVTDQAKTPAEPSLDDLLALMRGA